MLAAQRLGEVRVWAVDIDLLLEIASERVTRSLTDDECRQFLHAITAHFRRSETALLNRDDQAASRAHLR